MKNYSSHMKHTAKSAEELGRNTTRTIDGVEESDDYDDEGVFAVMSSSSAKDEWLIDSGATSHMTHSEESLRNYCPFETPE